MEGHRLDAQIGSMPARSPPPRRRRRTRAPPRRASRPGAGVQVALVDQHVGAARDRGDDAGREVGPARGAHPAVLAGDALERDDGPRGGDAGVGAAVHRRGAGVTGTAGEHRPPALDPEGAEHRAAGQALGLQHRPLLDVQLEVGRQALAPPLPRAAMARSRPRARRRRRERDALGVRQPRGGVQVQRARERRAAQQAAPEARPLLVGPVHQRHGARRPPGGGDRPERLERAEHAQRAVQPSARGHGVDVRADRDDLVGVALQRGPHVPGRVALDATGSSSRRWCRNERARSHSSVQATRRRALGAARQAVQLAQVGDRARGLHGQPRASGWARQCGPPPPMVNGHRSGS